MGRDTENGSLLRRTKNAMKVFSIMVTWSLESAIETADSMKSRGYGLPGRTAFSIYRFDDRDRAALLWLVYNVLGNVSFIVIQRYNRPRLQKLAEKTRRRPV